MLDKKTAISLNHETVDRMSKFKSHQQESFNNLLMRLLLKHGGRNE